MGKTCGSEAKSQDCGHEQQLVGRMMNQNGFELDWSTCLPASRILTTEPNRSTLTGSTIFSIFSILFLFTSSVFESDCDVSTFQTSPVTIYT